MYPKVNNLYPKRIQMYPKMDTFLLYIFVIIKAYINCLSQIVMVSYGNKKVIFSVYF